MKRGFIYILSNNSLKADLLKIGKTTKKSTDRSKQLSASTSIPENFKVEDEFEFADLNWAEKEIHNSLSEYRYNKKREFFTCEFDIAKQVIIETQIIDKQRQIDKLKKDINGFENILNSSEFIKHKWISFFKKLNWEFQEIKKITGKVSPDFILKTKEWNNYIDEKTNEEQIEILERPTDIYLMPNLPESSEKMESLEKLELIISVTDKNHRLIILSDKPIENLSSTLFGWRYNFVHKHWSEIQFVEKNEKYGLLDEERTWFCMINGVFLERENLFPDDEKMIKIWNS
ncbi:GIY-YIG nuclease family protein [Winogradskyella bathintestinalis]|uniref:GIY-YIG nuclease family protein n=1 Tax=Winogradskyella bathintestinalis TaxID=3035208 RepID=A0ABT7ZZH1_9FLAO|nr:GIY-YIG nuclease family protein [Winogradskyella bathintestinalis]MDN3494291.1 GIY-YIG nuclease family protein [Winogradskyella bathintestinalis]